MDKYMYNGKKFIIYLNITEILRILILCMCIENIYDEFNVNVIENSEIKIGISICLFLIFLTIIIEKFINYRFFTTPDIVYTIENTIKYYTSFLTIIYLIFIIGIGLRFIDLIKNQNEKIIILTYLLLFLILCHIIYLFSFCCKYKKNNKINNILRR